MALGLNKFSILSLSSESARMWSGCPKAGIRLQTETGEGGSSKAGYGAGLHSRGWFDTAQDSV